MRPQQEALDLLFLLLRSPGVPASVRCASLDWTASLARAQILDKPPVHEAVPSIPAIVLDVLSDVPQDPGHAPPTVLAQQPDQTAEDVSVPPPQSAHQAPDQLIPLPVPAEASLAVGPAASYHIYLPKSKMLIRLKGPEDLFLEFDAG